jgi:hypothetical protein
MGVWWRPRKSIPPIFPTCRARGCGGGPVVVEHPRIPFISYPYEWPFPALKAAALFHLDLQIELLADDVMLSDASAYNIQFISSSSALWPILIDLVSLRRYRGGEDWAGLEARPTIRGRRMPRAFGARGCRNRLCSAF